MEEIGLYTCVRVCMCALVRVCVCACVGVCVIFFFYTSVCIIFDNYNPGLSSPVHVIDDHSQDIVIDPLEEVLVFSVYNRK